MLLKYKVIGAFIFAFILASASVVAAELDAASWVHPNASIEEQVSEDDSGYLYLSAPKRVSNQLRFERSERFEAASITSLLLRFDRTEDMNAIWRYYEERLASEGQVAFTCEHRACGTSTNWANKVYEISKLTGRDSHQYYVAGQLSDTKTWVTVYLVTNGRRQNYAYVQLVSVEDNAPSGSASGQGNSALLLERFDADSFEAALIQSVNLWNVQAGDRLLLQVFFPLVGGLSQSNAAAEQVKTKALSTVTSQFGVDEGRVSVLMSGPISDEQAKVQLSLWKLAN